ncbi:Thiol-disulfide oxidoreductase ResA [Rubripirellula lacrimiformis]|uniref:Thiol-disulfide oxidoreductase ResA n=2 Tax=Rubripirellula lacrimiformis TaxID=1930273 RepID=A0A517NHL0_9BACT|nr:Thiol-disulfide oxidoreductase ResA [Rubripirellula lacrimiformis]
MTDHLLLRRFLARVGGTRMIAGNRRLRLIVAGAVAGSVVSVAGSAVAASPSPVSALALKPVQDGVDFETVTPDVAAKCSVNDIDRKGWFGWEVVSPDGMMLRRFADTNGDKKIDLWSYYKFGVEVYRDVDEDFNGKADQYRWLGTGGTRWGMDDDEDGRIDRWKQISAEEVSAELVAALRDADAARFARLLITADELKSLGLGKEKTELLSAKADRAARDFQGLAKRQSSVGSKARWVQFAASPPGIVPEGTDGSTSDVMVYENAVAMFEESDKGGQLLVGTLIRSDDAWRLVELPSVGGDGEAIAQTTGNFFTPGGSGIANGAAAGGIGEATQRLVTALESVDGKLAEATNKSDIAKLHGQRADVIEDLISNAEGDAVRDSWVRQLVDTLSLAIQSGAYPDGMERLRKVSPRFGSKDEQLAAYADYQAISTEYVLRQTPEADFAEVQKWYLEALTGFVDRYPRTPETAQAYLQLALSKEFEDKEAEALDYYKKVAAAFPGTDAGEKAAGAARRLDSVGRRIELEGGTIDGKSFSLASLRGKPVVVHYWATWCEPCKQDMKLLRRLQAAYQRAGLQLVGVNVDATGESAAAYLRENPLPWVQMFEPGGLESSRLAKTLGVQTLPTMMLIDADGKVVRHNVRAAELDEELTSMLKRK